uniref:Uncharacterized protein n=1 Tax=Magallana gigas TaxID=29159 RepID=K1PX49_MAGGI
MFPHTGFTQMYVTNVTVHRGAGVSQRRHRNTSWAQVLGYMIISCLSLEYLGAVLLKFVSSGHQPYFENGRRNIPLELQINVMQTASYNVLILWICLLQTAIGDYDVSVKLLEYNRKEDCSCDQLAMVRCHECDVYFKTCVQPLSPTQRLCLYCRLATSRDYHVTHRGYLNECVAVTAFSSLAEFKRRGIAGVKYDLVCGLP